MSSLEEEAVGAVYLFDEVGKARGTEHHVRHGDWFGRVLVFSAWRLAGHEAWVDVIDRHLVALLGPGQIILWEDVGAVYWVVCGHSLGLG